MNFIMGVDIGFVNTGLSLFRFFIKDGKAIFKLIGVCVITTAKSDKKKNMRAADDDIRRINEITQQINSFIDKHTSKLDSLIVFAEAPTGGAQSAKANRAMGMATTIPAVIFEMREIPVEYVSPNDVKVAVAGSRTASKLEIMDKVIKMIGGTHELKSSGKKKLHKYTVLGKTYGLVFEHIADSVGAVLHGKKNSTLYRLFVNQ